MYMNEGTSERMHFISFSLVNKNLCFPFSEFLPVCGYKWVVWVVTCNILSYAEQNNTHRNSNYMNHIKLHAGTYTEKQK